MEQEFVCQCECGGNVLGVRSFGRLWTACDRCSPVVRVHLDTLRLCDPEREKVPVPVQETPSV
jgi:hypothetical protein